MSRHESWPVTAGVVRTFIVGKPAQPAPSTRRGDESAATPLLAGGAIALVAAAGAWTLRRRAARC
jgi:hypothetical protein